MFTSSLLTSVPLGRESALNMLNLLRSMVKKTESSPVLIFFVCLYAERRDCRIGIGVEDMSRPSVEKVDESSLHALVPMPKIMAAIAVLAKSFFIFKKVEF